MANIIYATVTGEKQGMISAGCGTSASIGNKYQINHTDEIFVLQFDHSISREHNVLHHPVKFYKPIDKSSPLLSAAISENENYRLYLTFIEPPPVVVLKDFTLLSYRKFICLTSHPAILMC